MLTRLSRTSRNLLSLSSRASTRCTIARIPILAPMVRMFSTHDTVGTSTRFDHMYPEKSNTLKTLSDPMEALHSIFLPEDQELPDDLYISIKNMCSINPDIATMDTNKLHQRIFDLSKIVLHPNFYTTYLERFPHCSLPHVAIPAEPPVSIEAHTHGLPVHPLVQYIILRIPTLLRRRDFNTVLNDVQAAFPGRDPHTVVARYPLVMTFDWKRRMPTRIQEYTTLIEDPEIVRDMFYRQPDLLHCRTDLVTAPRMDKLAEIFNFTNDQIITFVNQFPRYLSHTLTSNRIRRLLVFRMCHPDFHVNIKDIVQMLSDTTAKVSVEGLERIMSIINKRANSTDPVDPNVPYMDYFADNIESLYEAIQTVLTLDDRVFRLLFTEYYHATRDHESNYAQRISSKTPIRGEKEYLFDSTVQILETRQTRQDRVEPGYYTREHAQYMQQETPAGGYGTRQVTVDTKTQYKTDTIFKPGMNERNTSHGEDGINRKMLAREGARMRERINSKIKRDPNPETVTGLYKNPGPKVIEEKHNPERKPKTKLKRRDQVEQAWYGSEQTGL